MRQFSPPTNLLLTCLAAIGLVVSLGLPWYGAAQGISDSPQDVGTIAGPIEGAAALVARWFSASDGAIGSEILGSTTQNGLIGLALASILLSAAMVVPALRRLAREGLHVIPLAAPAFVVLNMVDQPGAGGMELRPGILIALAAGLMMASAAWHGASLRGARKAPAAYQAPPAPTGRVTPPSF